MPLPANKQALFVDYRICSSFVTTYRNTCLRGWIRTFLSCTEQELMSKHCSNIYYLSPFSYAEAFWTYKNYTGELQRRELWWWAYALATHSICRRMNQQPPSYLDKLPFICNGQFFANSSINTYMLNTICLPRSITTHTTNNVIDFCHNYFRLSTTVEKKFTTKVDLKTF